MTTTTEQPLACRVRNFLLLNPTLNNQDLHKLWQEKYGEIQANIIRSARSFLKKKFYGDLPLVHDQLSKAAVIRRIIDNNPDFTDADIMKYMGACGFEVTRSCVSSTRSVAKKAASGTPVAEEVQEVKSGERGYRTSMVREYLKKHPNASSKDTVKALAKKGVSVSLGLVSVIKYSKKRGLKKQDAQEPRARYIPTVQAVAQPRSYDEIEQQLEDLIQAAKDLGNSELANSIRNSRRLASVAILQK